MKIFRKITYCLNKWFSKDSPGQLEEADAIILEFQPAAFNRNEIPEVRLLLQVMPRNGRNFITECEPTITSLQASILHAGYKLKVSIDPKHPHRIILPVFE